MKYNQSTVLEYGSIVFEEEDILHALLEFVWNEDEIFIPRDEVELLLKEDNTIELIVIQERI